VLDHLEMAPKPRKGTTDAWIRKAFRLAAKRALDDLPGDDELQAVFLVICDGRAWSIDPSLAVTRSAHGYQAIGAGAAVALGALHATRGRRDHEVRVRTALEAAAAHADGVAPPFHVELVR
jgi:ATP-dependent protease HslVU (ClpYQ) peptidase subunit